MCVRYTVHKTDAAIGSLSKALGVPLGNPDWVKPRFNATLTDLLPVVAREGGETRLRPMRWGFVPYGERSKPHPKLLPNAKAETADMLPTFRTAVARRRCLVPANGFYEWSVVGGQKQPHLFTLRDGEPFAFAGIWDPAEGDLPETFCILTTQPNALVARVHDRMPVLLPPEGAGHWIGDTPLDPYELRRILAPLDPARMESRPVSRYMSNSRNEGPKCLEPPEAPEPEFDFGA